MTNFEKYRDTLLSDSSNKNNYDLARERIRIDMMLEKLKEQVLEEEEKDKIIEQISMIRKDLTKNFIDDRIKY